MASPKKRARDRTGPPAGDLARVAEMVMVLSATASMRRGGEPTAAEAALVAEARQRLAGLCEGVRPKDLFAREAVRAVVEDLGLNRSRDPVMGFRSPKLSIAEKVLLSTERKMEESKEAAVHSSIQLSRDLPVSQGTSFETHGMMLHGTPRFIHDKPSVSLSAGMVQKRSATTHVPALASAAPFKQPHVNELHSGVNPVKPVPSYTLALPHTEAVEAQLITQSRAMPGEPNELVDNAFMTTEANAVQSPNQVTRHQDVKTSAMQPGPGNLLVGQSAPQGLTYISTPSIFTHHSDIAKNVQQLLHQKVSNHPSWTLPSTEYMNKPLNCQVCKIIITDVESLLVCDNCERATHFKCLQSYGNKGTPKAEWHCPKCLMLNNGKPLPPKYGKVTRAIGTPANNPNAGLSHPSADKSAENSGIKDNQQKLLASGNSSLSNTIVTSSTAHDQGEVGPNTGTLGADTQANCPACATIREDVVCVKTLSNHQEEVGLASSSTGTQSVGSLRPIQNSGLSLCSMSSTLESGSQSMAVSKSECSLVPSKTEAELQHHSFLQEERGAMCAKSLSKNIENGVVMCAGTLANLQDEGDGLVSRNIGTQSQGSGLSPCTASSTLECFSEAVALSKSASSHNPSNTEAEQSDPSRSPSESFVKNDLKVNRNIETLASELEAINEPTACKLGDPSNRKEASEDSAAVNARSDDGHDHKMTPNGALDSNGESIDCTVTSLPEIHAIDWVGDALEVVDGKTYYRSCHIDGTLYTLQDHVLFASDGCKRFPSKLQSLWEENESGSKWAIVEPYIFPNDIPRSVSQPSNFEDHEIYAANDQKTILACSICGPCEVLLIDKFRQESKWRSQVSDRSSSYPIFLCRWKYDESKGIFDSITT